MRSDPLADLERRMSAARGIVANDSVNIAPYVGISALILLGTIAILSYVRSVR